MIFLHLFAFLCLLLFHLHANGVTWDSGQSNAMGGPILSIWRDLTCLDMSWHALTVELARDSASALTTFCWGIFAPGSLARRGAKHFTLFLLSGISCWYLTDCHRTSRQDFWHYNRCIHVYIFIYICIWASIPRHLPPPVPPPPPVVWVVVGGGWWWWWWWWKKLYMYVYECICMI